MNDKILKRNIDALKKQLSWLERSSISARNIGIKGSYTAEEFDNFETFAGRFARSVDFLIRKVFRSLDDIEFEIQGTLVDAVNNAHKRGLFDEIAEIRSIRDLRNEIVYEYLEEKLEANFSGLEELSPKLIAIIGNTIRYSERYLQIGNY